MGRTKKTVEAELLDPEQETPPTKPITRLVDAEHTIKYREPVPVPIQETEDESIIWDEEDEEQKQRKKPHKSVREKIQEKLGKAKITGGDQVFLRIDRMPNYDSGTGSLDGMAGEKEFCWRGPCTIDYITNDDYLADAGKRHGAGVYWFTLRHGKIIVAMWQHKIGGNPQVATQAIDSSTGQAQIIYQSIPQQNGQTITQPIPVTKTLKEVADIIEVVDRIRGNVQPLQPQIVQPSEPAMSPKVALLSAMAENPEIVEAVTDKLMGGARGDHKPSITELLIRHGAELAKGLGDMLTGVIRTAASEVKQIKALDAQLIAQQNNGGQNNYNVQAEMATQAVQDQNVQGFHNRQNSQVSGSQAIGQEMETSNQALQSGGTRETFQPNAETQQLTDPKDILIQIALTGCQQQTPPRVIASQLLAFADRVEDEAPHMSVYGWIDLFVENTPEQIVEFMKSGMLGENAREVSQLPQTQNYISQLRELLQEQKENGENEE